MNCWIHDLLQSREPPQAEVRCSYGQMESYKKQQSATGFDLAEAALPNSSATASPSDVAQKKYKASHAVLGYVNATKPKAEGPRRGESTTQRHELIMKTYGNLT